MPGKEKGVFQGVVGLWYRLPEGSLGHEQRFLLGLGHAAKLETGKSRPREAQGSAVSTENVWAACGPHALASFISNPLIPGANGNRVLPELLSASYIFKA